MSLSDAVEAAFHRHRTVAFDQLPECDRILIAIWTLEADVNNGGFHQYYFNSAGNYARVAPVALRAIGARAMADLVDRANGVFGPEGPPTPRDARQEALLAHSQRSWDALDRQFWAYPDDLAALLGAFLNAHSSTPPFPLE